MGKQARVVEEVTVRKDVQERPQTVLDNVRRTEVHSEDLAKKGRSTDLDYFEPGFRRHYQTAYSNQDYDYTRYKPAYQYGYELAGNQRYSGRSWDEIEPQVQREWEQRNPRAPWDQFRDAIRQGWEAVHNYG